jgi:hypothetical protein
LLAIPFTQPWTDAWLNGFSRFAWSNISRDGSMYAVLVAGEANQQSLVFGSVNGGKTTTFAQINDSNLDGILGIAGWTTI